MGQYQGKSTKGVDDELSGEQKPDTAVDHATSDPKAIAGVTNADVQPQPPVFGSPLDNESFLASLDSASLDSSSISDASPEKESTPLKRNSNLVADRSTIPIVFRWDSGGSEVYLCGTFNNWESKIPMTNSQGDFTAIVDLEEGLYEYKFFVDGQWMHDPTERSTDNGLGSRNNVVEVEKKHFEAFFETWEMTSSDKKGQSPPGSYSQLVPPRSHASGLPPVLPPLLQQTILNQDQPYEDPAMLPQPNHVILNHLYALSIKDNVLVLAATHRYKEKYVTILTYKPVLL